jgi:hypothetical protein
MSSQELHHESLSAFNSLLDTCDVVLLCKQNFYVDMLLPDEVQNIKTLLVKEFYNTTVEKVERIKMNQCILF